MTDAREQVIAGLEAAIRDPHCPLQYSPLLMQAQKLLRAIAPPEPTEGLRAHKIMTSQEYRDLNLKGWHMVCRDYDGPRSVGIRYTGGQTGSMPLQQRTINETTPSHNLLMQAENMLAAWERMYRLINPRDNFPKVFADLTEDMEFRELQWLRRAVAEAKPAMVAEERGEKS